MLLLVPVQRCTTDANVLYGTFVTAFGQRKSIAPAQQGYRIALLITNPQHQENLTTCKRKHTELHFSLTKVCNYGTYFTKHSSNKRERLLRLTWALSLHLLKISSHPSARSLCLYSRKKSCPIYKKTLPQEHLQAICTSFVFIH